jgi:hypothetical protein
MFVSRGKRVSQLLTGSSDAPLLKPSSEEEILRLAAAIAEEIERKIREMGTILNAVEAGAMAAVEADDVTQRLDRNDVCDIL